SESGRAGARARRDRLGRRAVAGDARAQHRAGRGTAAQQPGLRRGGRGHRRPNGLGRRAQAEGAGARAAGRGDHAPAADRGPCRHAHRSREARRTGADRRPRAGARPSRPRGRDRAHDGGRGAAPHGAEDIVSDLTAVYPGTFDPVTNGHLDIIRRGSRLFSRVIVAILVNADKAPFFTVEETAAMVEAAVSDLANVKVETFEGLLVDYARRGGAGIIVRGLRAVSDLEYELQMAMMNRRMNDAVETVFMMPSESYSYVSSRLVREVVMLGGEVSGLVPPAVAKALA